MFSFSFFLDQTAIRGYLTRKKVKPHLEEFRRNFTAKINSSNAYNVALNDLLNQQKKIQTNLMVDKQQCQQKGMKFVAERMKMYQNHGVDFELAKLNQQIQSRNHEAHRQLRLQRHCISIESLNSVPNHVQMPPRIDCNRISPIISKIRDNQSDVNNSYPAMFHDITDIPITNG